MTDCVHFYCDNCEKRLSYIHLDGYVVGDRLLEGAMFRVFPAEGWTHHGLKGKHLGVSVEPSCAEYLSALNPKWIKEVLEYAEDTGEGNCPDCEYECSSMDPKGWLL